MMIKEFKQKIEIKKSLYRNKMNWPNQKSQYKQKKLKLLELKIYANQEYFLISILEKLLSN